MEDEIKVLTLNSWGLLYISKDVEIRVKYIAEELSKGQYDIVALQEIWSQRHFDYIAKTVAGKLPYSYYFHSGVIGSGCATFSRYPIIDTFYQRFMHNGYFWDVFHGDWFGGKGLGCTILQHPKRKIYFFNTHLHASYHDDNFLECRTLQMYQLTQIMNQTTRPGDAIILCGDFNHHPDELGVMSLAEIAHVADSYEIAATKPVDCFTSNTNRYSDDGPPERIDYIFVSDNFKCTSCCLAMQQIPGTDMFYSDHDGYTVTLTLKDEENFTKIRRGYEHIPIRTLKRIHDVITLGEQRSEEIAWGKLSFLFILVSLLIALPLLSAENFHAYITSTHLNTWSGKFVFVIQAILIVACLIYAWTVIIIRRIDVKSFKNVSNEIQLKLHNLSGVNDKKIM